MARAQHAHDRSRSPSVFAIGYCDSTRAAADSTDNLPLRRCRAPPEIWPEIWLERRRATAPSHASRSFQMQIACAGRVCPLSGHCLGFVMHCCSPDANVAFHERTPRAVDVLCVGRHTSRTARRFQAAPERGIWIRANATMPRTFVGDRTDRDDPASYAAQSASSPTSTWIKQGHQSTLRTQASRTLRTGPRRQHRLPSRSAARRQFLTRSIRPRAS